MAGSLSVKSMKSATPKPRVEQREVRPLAVVGDREGVDARAAGVAEAVDAVEQHRRAPARFEHRRDVIDLEPAARAGGEQQRALRVGRVLPDVELVRVQVVLVEQLRVGGVVAGDVVEAQARAARRSWHWCAPLPPQLVCRTISTFCERHTRSSREDSRGLPSYGGPISLRDERVRRVLGVDDDDAGVVGVAVLAVGAAADVDVALVDGDRGVHAAAHQRLVPDLRERARQCPARAA